MKKLLALMTALTLVLALASCGDDKPAEISSVPVASAASVAPVASIAPVPTPEPVPEGPANLALEGTAFDMNEGLTADDNGFIPYYDENNGVAGNAFDANVSTGWQPKGTSDADATPVTYNNDADEGFFEETSVAEDGTESVVKKYNLHEGSENLPENWYFTGEEKTEIREKAVYESGKVFVGVRFDEAVTSDCIVIKWEDGSVAETYEDGGYYLEYTADGEKWEKLDVTVERGEDNGVSIDDTAAFEKVEAKGFRLITVACVNKWGTKVYEMEVYAAEEEAPAEETPAESAEETAE